MNESIAPDRALWGCCIVCDEYYLLLPFVSFVSWDRTFFNDTSGNEVFTNIARNCFIPLLFGTRKDPSFMRESVYNKFLTPYTTRTPSPRQSFCRLLRLHGHSPVLSPFHAVRSFSSLVFVVPVLLTVASGSKKTNTREDRPSDLPPKYNTVMEEIEVAIMIETRSWWWFVMTRPDCPIKHARYHQQVYLHNRFRLVTRSWESEVIIGKKNDCLGHP